MTAAHRARRASRSEGFTLIELLVVMVIIGILAGIAVPVFLDQRKKAWDASAKSDMHTAILSMIGYYSSDLQFTNESTVMSAYEPSVAWLKSFGVNTPYPPVDTVAFEIARGGTLSAATSTAVLSIRSKSNTCFYARIIEDTTSLGAPGVTYLSRSADCPDPWDLSEQIVNTTY